MDRKQEEKIRKAFSERKAGFGAKRLFARLSTDEELALCAKSCRYAEMKEYAIGAVGRVQSAETLLSIALSAPLDWTRNAAVDRLAGNRALLQKILQPRFDTPKWLWEATAKRAGAHLTAMETERIEACGTDRKQLCELLCRREITEAYDLALDRIDDPSLLITVAQSSAAQPVVDGALSRLCDLVKRDRNADPLLSFLNGTDTPGLRQKAENRLAALCAGDDPLPLSDAQRETLFRYYSVVRDLNFMHGVGLLKSEQLMKLYKVRKKEIDQLDVAAHIPPAACTEEIRERLFFAKGQTYRAKGEAAYQALSDDALIEAFRRANDERLLFFLYTLLSERGLCTEEIDAKMDTVVLPKIDAAWTADGYDGQKLCQLDLALTPKLRERYGFEEVFDRGETIDGGSWSSKKLRFQGCEYWFYYGQSDGGGAYRSMGERIR